MYFPGAARLFAITAAFALVVPLFFYATRSAIHQSPRTESSVDDLSFLHVDDNLPLVCPGPCRWNLTVPEWVHEVNRGTTSTPPQWCTVAALEKPSPVLMTDEERAFFIAKVAGAVTYFEWGPGHSTYLAMLSGSLLRITSVDTVPGSLACVLSHPQMSVSTAIVRGLFVDIVADPENWGNPRSNATIARWPSVSDAILFEPDPRSIDVVYVDGRFRTASILKAAAVLRDTASILVHDYLERPAYHFGVQTGLLQEIERAGRTVLLRRGETARAFDALPRREAVARWRDEFAKVELLPQ